MCSRWYLHVDFPIESCLNVSPPSFIRLVDTIIEFPLSTKISLSFCSHSVLGKQDAGFSYCVKRHGPYAAFSLTFCGMLECENEAFARVSPVLAVGFHRLC